MFSCLVNPVEFERRAAHELTNERERNYPMDAESKLFFAFETIELLLLEKILHTCVFVYILAMIGELEKMKANF